MKNTVIIALSGIIMGLGNAEATPRLQIDTDSVLQSGTVAEKPMLSDDMELSLSVEAVIPPDTEIRMDSTMDMVPQLYRNIYAQPYSFSKNVYVNKGRLWANTGVLVGAFVGSLFVLECLPEDATSWNRAEIQKVPLFKRWKDNVLVDGPEWDGDKFYFNYLLHPYAGAAYFMAARSCGLGFWRSMLYSAAISTFGWEFGIEAFMERPSYQDLFITPVIGSCIGELFYRLKRHIVGNNYTLAGSPILGNIVVFLIDPVNEVLNLFRGSDTRRMHLGAKPKRRQIESSFVPTASGGRAGFTLMVYF